MGGGTVGEATLQVTGVTRREAWIALLYFALYLGYLT
jgi:CRISPR/Cas system endoribonuclease Cas6 (RAMP superfamily)